MGMSRGNAIRWSLGGLALIGALALHDLWQLRRIVHLNESIGAGTPPEADVAGAPRELRFAQAYARAASGAGEAALNRYSALHADDALGRAARYNSANLLLRQAIELRAGPEPGQALALVELAKENYRQILRSAADDWDARYNLERAQRLVPEPEQADDEPPDLKRNAERAATTMRAYSPGLP
ncbi:MAG TPA: MxaK protein [Burkholderiaceae bacterium]|nr:MxaK protein [Burkholderiaceae bacterium]